jgi:hypothetical protein
LRLGEEWPDRLTWIEYEALAKRKQEADDGSWMRASIIATSVLNVNRKEKSKPLPLDAFVPKRGGEEKPQTARRPDPTALLNKAKLLQAQMLARAKK